MAVAWLYCRLHTYAGDTQPQLGTKGPAVSAARDKGIHTSKVPPEGKAVHCGLAVTARETLVGLNGLEKEPMPPATTHSSKEDPVYAYAAIRSHE